MPQKTERKVRSSKKEEKSIRNGYLFPTWRCTSAQNELFYSLFGPSCGRQSTSPSTPWLRTSEFKLISMFTVAANMEAVHGAPFFASLARRSLLSQSVIKIETCKNRTFYSFHLVHASIIERKMVEIYLGQLYADYNYNMLYDNYV